jgi:peptidoglycan L-alanyl-D-glutamate endopeptidase CwlK
MSAGIDYTLAKPTGDLAYLAPGFRKAVEAAMAECTALGLDAMVYETYRSSALQALYYQRGRTVRPPDAPVTNARTNLYSWHGYGLAVDVIHRAQRWEAPLDWFREVSEVFKKYSCKWGGDWTSPDLPHLLPHKHFRAAPRVH